jgi:hypothetical protein
MCAQKLPPSNQWIFGPASNEMLWSLGFELEIAEYSISLKVADGNSVHGLFMDYFVLVPSEYFDLSEFNFDVKKPCQDNDDSSK